MRDGVKTLRKTNHVLPSRNRMTHVREVTAYLMPSSAPPKLRSCTGYAASKVSNLVGSRLGVTAIAAAARTQCFGPEPFELRELEHRTLGLQAGKVKAFRGAASSPSRAKQISCPTGSG